MMAFSKKKSKKIPPNNPSGPSTKKKWEKQLPPSKNQKKKTLSNITQTINQKSWMFHVNQTNHHLLETNSNMNMRMMMMKYH